MKATKDNAAAASAVEAPSGKGAADENFPVGSFLLPKRLRLFLLIFGILGPSGALDATVMIYGFVMALGGALLLLNAFLQRRRSMLSALGLAFLGSILPVASLILEATGR